MCKEKSAIITKDNFHCYVGIDSHADIVAIAGLSALEQDKDKIGFVKLEFLPPSSPDDLHDFRQWTFRVDQDIIPDWYDPSYARECCENWVAKHSLFDGAVKVLTGNWYIVGSGVTVNKLTNGEIYRNYGTVISNYGTVLSNYGTVLSNDGTVASNEGTVSRNYGTLLRNYGTVTTNDGTVTSSDGSVVSNYRTVLSNYGTVATNDGTVGYNEGTVGRNYATLVNNYATLVNNYGTVAKNYGTVASNNGTILTRVNK